MEVLSRFSEKEHNYHFYQARLNAIRVERSKKQELEEARNKLERRVNERTAEFKKANELLQQKIAESEQIEKALRVSEARYKALFDRSLLCVFLHDFEGNFLDANDSGGFSIAEGFKASGLSNWCGQVFAGLGLTNPLLVVVCVCLLMTFLTEITSNTATTQVMLPILAGAAASSGVHPLMLMLPATLSASCAFMLPISTPPNAIIFGSGQVDMARMVRTGLLLNLSGVLLITVFFTFVCGPILGLDPATLPEWALPPLPSGS